MNRPYPINSNQLFDKLNSAEYWKGLCAELSSSNKADDPEYKNAKAKNSTNSSYNATNSGNDVNDCSCEVDNKSLIEVMLNNFVFLVTDAKNYNPANPCDVAKN